MADSDAAPVDREIRDRKKRLWKLGFHCFTAAQNIDESLDPPSLELELNAVFDGDSSTVDLVYATLEFQMYTRWSPRLGVINNGQLLPSNGNVRGYLDTELTNAANPQDTVPSGTWTDVWERCIEIWEGARDQQVYRCPVLIELLKDVPGKPSEHTDLDSCQVGRANVWWFLSDDRNQYFSARDVSGWFEIDTQDKAFVSDASSDEKPYLAPADIHKAEWLYKRRIFAIGRVAPKLPGQPFGASVVPWQAVELRPKLLGGDRDLIAKDTQWAGVFRIIRAVSEAECLGYFDVVQAYDDANLSIPLFHYAVQKRTQADDTTQLGGVSVWLNTDQNRPDERRQSFAGLGLRNPTWCKWQDDLSTGDDYDTGSGEDICSASSITAPLLPPTSALTYEESLQLHRRPHMMYRYAMHLRTVAKTRQALWQYAVHLLRQVVWLRIPDVPGVPKGWANLSLGQVVHSERALALILRIAVKNPGFISTSFKKAPKEVFVASSALWNKEHRDALLCWMKAAWETAKQDQVAFEAELVALLTGEHTYLENGERTTIPDLAAVDVSTLKDVANWPQANIRHHLNKAEVKTGLGILAVNPGSSPFIEEIKGKRIFKDALEPWWKPAKSAYPLDNCHPTPAHAPGYYTPQILREAAKRAGIAPGLFKAEWKDIPDALIQAQTAREVQSAAACGYAFDVDNQVVPNGHAHNLRSHNVFNQRWARLQLYEFDHRQRRSALLCTSATKLAGASIVWKLDDEAGFTINAFDGCDGSLSGPIPIGKFKGNVTPVTVLSEGDSLGSDLASTFDISSNLLAARAFELFKLAVQGLDTQALPKVDSFSLTISDKSVNIRFAWLKQTLRYEDNQAPAGELGLYLQFLSWRLRDITLSDPARDYLSATGFEFNEHNDKDRFFSFSAKPSLDPWALALAPRLWKPKAIPKSTTSSMEIAAALLTWPSLHRWRTMLRTSSLARRAMWDLWRVSLREVLNAPVMNLGFGSKLRLFDLFQSEFSLKAIALWAHVDAASLRKSWGSAIFQANIKAWLLTDVKLKNYSDWVIDHEAIALDFLIDQLADPKLKTKLKIFRPNITEVRQYQANLASVFYLDELEGTEWPGAKSVASASTGFIITPAANRPFGIALLTEPAPANALVQAGANDVSSYWVTGIAPIVEPDTPQQNLLGAALRFTTPVEVTIKAGSITQSVDLVGPGADNTEQNVQLLTGDVTSGFMLEADIGSWLGPLGDGVKIILVAAGEVHDQSVDFKLGLRIEIPWLRRPIEYPLTAPLSITDIKFDRSNRAVNWNFGAAMRQSIEDALPFRVFFADSQFLMSLKLDNTLIPSAKFEASFKTIEIQLGSPIAALGLSPESDTQRFSINAELTKDSAAVALTAPLPLSVTLRMELAATIKGEIRVVPTECIDKLLAPIVIELVTVHVPLALATATPILLTADGPQIPAWLFRSNNLWSGKNSKAFTLLDISDQWFAGTAASLKAALKKVSKRLTPASLTLEMLLDFYFEGEDWGGVTADCELKASCTIDNDDYLVLAANAFSCEVSVITLNFTVPESAREPKFGEIAKLKLPQILSAKLDLSGKGDTLVFDLDKQPLEITIPASGGYTFDVEKFGLGSAGATLKATVRSGNIKLDNLPTLSDSLCVHKASEEVGRLLVERGRLVSASISADARLKFFDDAEGVLTLSFFQQQTQTGVELGAMADFKVAMGRTFHVQALCLQVQVDSINLSLRYSNVGSKWSATGGMTGSLAFEPNGLLSGRLAEYSDLFDGTRAHFENLDLAKLGEASLKVWITPRTFDLAGIFQVTLRGMEIHKLGELSLKSVGLLGDIAFKVPMPSLRCDLTLGDIRLWQPDIDAVMPRIQVMSLGIDVGLASGFEFKGSLTEFDDDQEFGFGGVASLESEAFPGTRVTVKLTRVLDPNKNQEPKPSFVVYADTDRTDSLGYGFFLRKLGLGVAANQGLKHFSTSDKREFPMAQRVEAALREGIPYPGWLQSWVPDYPPDNVTYYSLVGVAQVTFGLLDRKTDHPFVTTLVLSIDDQLDIMAGISGWFLVSPDDALLDAYVSAPAVRGAVGLSPREQVLYGRFLTLPNAKFGPSVESSIVAKMLHLALDSCQLSVSFYCDPRGALLEIGYPRQARYTIDLGLAKGIAESGFRIGYYRGTHVVGLNLAIAAEVGMSFSGDLGFANVELSARAAFQLQASFAGALTSSGQMYVLADLTFSAFLEISARIYKRIRVSGFWGSFSLTLFDISGSVRLTVTVSVSAAIVPAGLGFSGTAEVALDVCGFQFSARLRIASNPERVIDARQQIDSLVPPIKEIIQNGSPQPTLVAPRQSSAEFVENDNTPSRLRNAIGLKASPAPSPQHNTKWCYHVRRVNGRTRVVFYPDPSQFGNGYPVLPEGEPANVRSHWIKLNDAGKSCLQGGVGCDSKYDTQRQPLEYTIIERATETIVPASHLRGDAGAAGKEVLAEHLLQNLLTKPHQEIKEVVDPRTRHPVAGDFDDPAVLVDPGRRSTRFRKRASGSDGETTTYDDYLAKAHRPNTNAVGDAGKISDGELLSSLLRLAESPDAEVGKQEPVEIGNELNPLRFPAMLGLVLEFTDLSATVSMADLIAQKGIAAFADEIRMFGKTIEIDDWRDPIGPNQRFLIEPDLSYWFQGQGEIGLSWQLTRWSNGDEMRHGPASHSGIRHFEIRREVLAGNLKSETFTVLPNWLVWNPSDGPVCYYVRPQFQFVDSGLPTDRSLTLRYTVRAIGPIGSKSGDADGTLCTEVFDLVRYQPVKEAPRLLQAQALMRMQGKHNKAAQLEFCVMLDCQTTPGQTTPELQSQLNKRLKVYSRPVPTGIIGTYGSGNETDVSLQWHEELSGSELRIAQPVQSRRMSKTTLSDAVPLGVALAWEIVLQKTNDERTTVVLRATRPFESKNEDSDWDLHLGEMVAAEFYVRLDAVKTSGDALDVPTPFQRCRIAITDQLQPEIPLSKDVDATQAMFSEGREVAALERFPVYGQSRSREWASAADFSVKPDIQCLPGKDKELSVRLVGLLRHLTDTGSIEDKRYGPPMGYRVWLRDAIEDLENPNRPAPLQKVRSFSVLPEKVYRAMPQCVVAKTLSGPKGTDHAPQSDWYYSPEGALRFQPVKNTPAYTVDGSMACWFEKCTFHGGGEGAIHAAIDAFVKQLNNLDPVRRVEIFSDEPLCPPPTVGPFADRASQLLERTPLENDAFGWRLLEGIGCCATLWIEVDDDRLPYEVWSMDDEILNYFGLAVISFERLPLQERDQHNGVTLYGVRVFVLETLRLLRNAAESGTGNVDVLLPPTVAEKKNWTALHYALDWLKPVPSGATVWPDSWFALVRAAMERSKAFIDLCTDSPQEKQKEKISACMWHFSGAYVVQEEEAGTDGGRKHTGGASDATSVLPVIAGKVEFIHELGVGYKRHLQVAVEIIRRYDFHAPQEGAQEPSDLAVKNRLHSIVVPRTLELQPEVLSMAVNPVDGSVNAWVQVHPTQCAHLYNALSRRVDFVEQTVELKRVQSNNCKHFAQLLLENKNKIKWAAFQASWESGSNDNKPTATWISSISPQGEPAEYVRQGYNSLRYVFLPPAYAWYVEGNTQAGVRVSADQPNQGNAAFPIEPMFCGKQGAGLEYLNLPFTWSCDGSQLEMLIPFARALDAIPQGLRPYWIAEDQTYDPSAEMVGMPALQTPDLVARYFIVARNEHDKVSVDLVAISFKKDSPAHFEAQLLVSPYTMANPTAQLHQFDGEMNTTPWLGRLALRCSLSLTAPELHWLAQSLRSDAPKWTLTIFIERDGIRYAMTEVL